MKKIAEKVVLIALICITVIFVLTTMLYVTNVIPQEEVQNNSVAVIILSVLAVIFLGLAGYLVYINFSENINVKRIMLFYDAESATRASSRVVNNIVKGCAKQLNTIKVHKTTLRVDEKQGLIATVYVEVAAEDVTRAIPELREQLIRNFQETLGLKFNAINFEIDKLRNKFIPDNAAKATPATVEAPAIETTETTNTAETEQTTQTAEPEQIETLEAKPIESPLSELFRTLEELEATAEAEKQNATEEEPKTAEEVK